jgi:SEC-C motif-containing protein
VLSEVEARGVAIHPTSTRSWGKEFMLSALASSPEALMRSRYTAYVVGDYDHIVRTVAPETLASFNVDALKAMASSMTWLSLDVREVTGGGPEDQQGTVEFAARFKEGGQEKVHHERANFRREDGRWVYVDGTMRPKGRPREVVKIGRNEPCPCGSGKKYKKCCGA